MIKILKGQSLFDIAIQSAGSIEHIFELAIENNISITESLDAGTQIIVPDNIELNSNVVSYYTRNSLKPATAIAKPMQLGGIGYMAIEIDFIVS